jgi:membrane associated rhomboid family serine protease
LHRGGFPDHAPANFNSQAGLELMTTPVTFLVLVVTAIATFLAFQRRDLWERWMFKPCEILRFKQYERLLTSGLIHLDWMHFAFNAFSFYAFARGIELGRGANTLLIIYLSAILGGSLLSLFIHRHHDYRALGASGGVCGVIFASIFLIPGGNISMFLIPIGIPAYAYAIIYLVLTFVALRRSADNVGHDAHFGGAIVGLLVATALYPSLILAQPGLFLAVLGLSIAMLLVIVFDPWHRLFANHDSSHGPHGGERFRRYMENRSRNQKLAEVDRLLDKVSARGLHSLSDSERKKLDQLSREIGRSR